MRLAARMLLVVAVLAATGCGARPEASRSQPPDSSAAASDATGSTRGASPGAAPSSTTRARREPTAERTSGGDGLARGPSALEDPTHPDLPGPLIDPGQLISGGPPPDGIPPIDRPRFQSAGDVDWLSADEPVLVLTLGDDTRAYPIQILTWHEIVNDTVGGEPVAVTYCPLCNSGVAFERTIHGEVTTFGTSGMLYADHLVMYDRATESLWPQLTGLASWGVRTGTQLRAIPLGTVGWGQFVAEHPDAQVLTRDTGYDRDYGRNPYAGYDEPGGEIYFDLPTEPDDRLEVKTRVVGIARNGAEVAISRERLAQAGVIGLDLSGARIVAWHVKGQRSALDDAELSDGREIGTVAVFSARASGRALTFSRVGDGFVDAETGSRWNVFGRAISGELAGKTLRRVTHLDTFWFAWVAFHPDTRLIS